MAGASIKDPALRNLMAARCTVCNAVFASDTAFQRHRYTAATRRRKCLTPRQMDRLGMTKGARNLRLFGINLSHFGCKTIEEFAAKY